MFRKSIKARLIAVFLGTALIISIAVGVHAFLMTNALLHKKADDVMAARCEAEGAVYMASIGTIMEILKAH